MEACINIVKEAARRAVEKYGNTVLDLKWFELRKLLIKEFGLPQQCWKKELLEQVVSSLKFEMKASEGGEIVLWRRLPYKVDIVSPGGGTFPAYTLAEAIYIGLYQDDPASAHEKMYYIIEPILLSDSSDLYSVRKALFVPAHVNVWDKLLENYVKFLEVLDEERREMVCRALEKTIDLLFYDLDIAYVNGDLVARVSFKNSKILQLCPGLMRVLKI